jgi:hypothetical protein
MLDHAFMEAIAALRKSFSDALLERQAVEESLTTDLLLGDLAFETSYTLPGEAVPARVQAEVTLEWSAWSQAAHRAVALGDEPEEPLELLVELRLRVQRLAKPPERDALLRALPDATTEVLGTPIERTGLATEELVGETAAVPSGIAVEAIYEGVLELPTEGIDLGPLGPWVASTLVRLADLDLEFLPPDE